MELDGAFGIKQMSRELFLLYNFLLGSEKRRAIIYRDCPQVILLAQLTRSYLNYVSMLYNRNLDPDPEEIQNSTTNLS